MPILFRYSYRKIPFGFRPEQLSSSTEDELAELASSAEARAQHSRKRRQWGYGLLSQLALETLPKLTVLGSVGGLIAWRLYKVEGLQFLGAVVGLASIASLVAQVLALLDSWFALEAAILAERDFLARLFDLRETISGKSVGEGFWKTRLRLLVKQMGS